MVDLSLTAAFLLSALISGAIGVYSWQRRNSPGHLELAGLMAAATIWSLTSALEWLASAYNVKVFWSVLSYLGSQTTAVFFFLFVQRYTQQAGWLTKKREALFFVFPLIAFIMAATNSRHHLLWTQVSLQTTSSGWTHATYYHGPWFWVQIVYAYALIAWGIYALLRSMLRFPHFYSFQTRYMVLGSLAPFAGNIVYAFRPATFGGADPTPIAFTLTGILLGWAFFRHQLLNIYPIARERLMEDLSDGIILMNTQQRVVDTNPVARKLLGLHETAYPDLIGIPIDQLIADWPSVAITCQDNAVGQMMLCPPGSQPHYLEVSSIRLQNDGGGQIGSLVILHDITQRRQAEQALQARERILTMMSEITSEALKASDTPALLQILADRMGALIGADGCYLTRWDEHSAATIPMAASGGMREIYPLQPPTPVEELSMTRSVLEAGHALVAEDVFNTPYLSSRIAAKYPSRSMLALPLIAGERKLGAVLVTFNTPHVFTPGEIAVEEQAAAQVALAVAKTRLLEELSATHREMQRELTEKKDMEIVLQQRAQELSALYDTSIDINSQLDLSHLLQTIIERAIALSGAQMGWLYLLQPATQVYKLAVSYQLPEYFAGAVLPPGQGVSGRVAVSGEILMITDYSHWDGHIQMFADLGIQRMLGVPLKTRGQVLGVLDVADIEENAIYTEEQVRLVSLFADQASIAVENARLFAELQAANSQLELLATIDKLTGAYNRRKYDDVLAYEIRKADRYHIPLALVMFDIDHFKDVNDSYGHHAADLALIELVKLVRENIRGSDWLARWGGEEFMVLAPGINMNQAAMLAEKIRGLIDSHHFASVEHITVSMGVTGYKAGDTPEEMTQRVDTAMYKAKDAGRNCFAVL